MQTDAQGLPFQLRFHPAAHGFGELTYNGKPQPRPAMTAAAGGVRPPEPVKEMLRGDGVRICHRIGKTRPSGVWVMVKVPAAW